MENNIPASWVECSLGEVCSKPQYGWTSKAGQTGEIKYLRTTDISDGELNWKTVPFCIEEPGESEKFQVKKNDILVSRAGSVGFNFRIKEDIPFKAVFASYLIRFKAYDDVTAKLIDYFLKSENYWKQISDFTLGIAIPNVNATKLEELKIPLPPLAEQHRIVAKLDSLFAKTESNKQRLEKIPIILKRFRQSVLAAAVSGKLTEEWRKSNFNSTNARTEVRTTSRTKVRATSKSKINSRTMNEEKTINESQLQNVCEVISGNAFKSTDFISSGVPVVKIANVQYGVYEQDTYQQFLPETFLEKHKRFVVNADDILIALTRPITNDTLKVCLYPKNIPCALLNQRVAMIRPDAKVLKEFILLYFQSYDFKEEIKKNLSETLQPNLSPKDLEKIVIVYPPLEEQKEIVKQIEQLFAFADKIESRYTKAKAMIDKLPQSILAKAFRGELVSQNADDEPASMLLERIAFERARTKVRATQRTDARTMQRTKVRSTSVTRTSVREKVIRTLVRRNVTQTSIRKKRKQ